MKGLVAYGARRRASHQRRSVRRSRRVERRGRDHRDGQGALQARPRRLQDGQYPEAIKELKKAYLLKRLPALLLNIGATYRKMSDLDNAVYYYKKYLAEAPDARDRGEVEKTLAEIEQREAGRRRQRQLRRQRRRSDAGRVAGAAGDDRQLEAHAGRRGAARSAARRARADAGAEGRQGLRLLSRRRARPTSTRC